MSYKPGDMVRLKDEPWHQHAGDVVIITKVNDNGCYDFWIPESRGSVPDHLIERKIYECKPNNGKFGWE